MFPNNGNANVVVNPSACFQPVAQLSILNICHTAVLSEEALKRKAAQEVEQCTDPLQRLQLRCLATSMGTGKKLVRHFFDSTDGDDSSMLSEPEFVPVLRAFPDISVSETEAQALFAHLSPQGTPVTVADVAQRLMAAMSAHRRALVQQLFQKMDPQDTGSVPLHALHALFDHRRQRAFEQGRATREQLWDAFRARFEPHADGRVLAAEWDAWWAAQGAAVASDIEFDWMVRNQWRI